MNQKTIFSSIQRPAIWPDLWRWGLRRTSWLWTGKEDREKELEIHREKATVWCRENEIGFKKAIMRLGFRGDILSVTELYPKIIAEANSRAQVCPFKMGGGCKLRPSLHNLRKNGSKCGD